ncbi:MAG: hypothetical protein HY433_02990 [Candidatus Liptonbacteria bacterium]|nr:hypothetical protein [Candidatus Liptonbacteria bacterium]
MKRIFAVALMVGALIVTAIVSGPAPVAAAADGFGVQQTLICPSSTLASADLIGGPTSTLAAGFIDDVAFSYTTATAATTTTSATATMHRGGGLVIGHHTVPAAHLATRGHPAGTTAAKTLTSSA